MTSTPETPFAPVSVAIEDVTNMPLDVPIEWMRFCYVCNGDHLFIADRVCNSGLVGTCSNCKDERIAAFTRVNSEVV